MYYIWTRSSSWFSNNRWRTLCTLNDQIQLHAVRMLLGSFIFPCHLQLIFTCHSSAYWDIFPIIPPPPFPGGIVTSDRFILSAPLPFSPLLRLSLNPLRENDIYCICNCRCPAPQSLSTSTLYRWCLSLRQWEANCSQGFPFYSLHSNFYILYFF